MTYTLSRPSIESGAEMLALLATLAATAAAPAWHPDVEAAEAFAHTRRGQVSFAVRTECGAWGRRQDRAVPSASVIKAMVLVAELQRGDVRDRPLTAGQKALLSPMIRRSDNTAATRVLGLVGPARLQRDAQHWGVRAFHLRSPWG
jgi:beta-lactamase class A